MKQKLNYTIRYTFLSLVIILTITILAANTYSAQTDGQSDYSEKRVLFISSYSYEWDTVPNQIAGIKEMLGNDVILNYQFMNTDWLLDEKNSQLFYETISHALEVSKPYDAVITGDDAALQFVLDYREELFPGIPVIFEGVNDTERAQKAAEEGLITGVVEKFSYKNNLDLAISLCPKANKIACIVDDTITGLGEKKQFYANEKDYPDFKFEEFSGSRYSKEEYKECLSKIGSDTIVIYLRCGEDKYGNLYTTKELNEIIKKDIKVPVFRLSQSEIGNGVFGGEVASHIESGKIAGDMTMRILNGEDPAKIKMVESPKQSMFDEQVMKKFGISKKQLPKDTIYVNREISFVEQYASIIVRALVSIIILLLLAGIIGISIHLKQRNQTLAVVETRNAQLAEAINTAQHANQAKTTFLARMTHEIRTPMNAILGITSLTRQCVEDAEKVEENLDKIEVSSKMLLNIINDVLDMSAIENDKIKIGHAEFDFKQILYSLESMYQALCSQKGVVFELELTDVMEESLIGDQLRLNQILNNLLSNALKFTESGGRITLRVIQQKIEAKQVYYQFAVEDTGCGMTEDMKGRIFKPFEQESTQTALEHGGSGLGMSITKNLVELMQGSIHVESEKGKGSVFTVYMPFERVENLKENVVSKEEKEAEYDIAGMHILLVDDTEINLSVAADLLMLAGAEVDCARNGQEAVEKFEASQPGQYHVILMDVQMPVLNGHEAARKIRRLERPDAQMIPIVAMTAHAFTEDVTASLEAGMNDHITKPIDTKILYTKLDEYYHA